MKSFIKKKFALTITSTLMVLIFTSFLFITINSTQAQQLVHDQPPPDQQNLDIKSNNDNLKQEISNTNVNLSLEKSKTQRIRRNKVNLTVKKATSLMSTPTRMPPLLPTLTRTATSSTYISSSINKLEKASFSSVTATSFPTATSVQILLNNEKTKILDNDKTNLANTEDQNEKHKHLDTNIKALHTDHEKLVTESENKEEKLLDVPVNENSSKQIDETPIETKIEEIKANENETKVEKDLETKTMDANFQPVENNNTYPDEKKIDENIANKIDTKNVETHDETKKDEIVQNVENNSNIQEKNINEDKPENKNIENDITEQIIGKVEVKNEEEVTENHLKENKIDDLVQTEEIPTEKDKYQVDLNISEATTTEPSLLNVEPVVEKLHRAESLSNILRTATVHADEAEQKLNEDDSFNPDLSNLENTVTPSSTIEDFEESSTTTTSPNIDISINTEQPSTNSIVKNESIDSQAEIESIKLIKNPRIKNIYPSKYCADITPIRDLFNHHIEPIYHPVIAMLPEDFQILLLDETSFAGMSTASCLIIGFCLGTLSIIWFLLLKKKENQQTNLTKNLNEQLLMLNNKIKILTFEKQTFESELNEINYKCNNNESVLVEKEEKFNELFEKYKQLKTSTDLSLKELEKLHMSEAKSVKDLNQCKLELNDITERYMQQKSEYDLKITNLVDEFNQRLEDLTNSLNSKETELAQCKTELDEKINSISLYRSNEIDLNNLIEQHEKKILILQNSLLRNKKHSSSNNSLDMNGGDEYVKINSDDLNCQQTTDLNSVMKTAELQMEIKNLEDRLSEAAANYELKATECLNLIAQLDDKEKYCEQFKLRQKQLEKNIKENEIQIKLLNELREKDTKQHIKSLTELDVQLKKKTTDAEKVSHLLDQLRVKQERIHELESQFSRVEKQSSQERQTFEKQAHENWLNAKKIDKELKETKNEVNVLKEKNSELEAINKSLMERQNGIGPGVMPNTRYYMLHQQQANMLAQQQQNQQQQLQNSNPDSNKLSNDSSPKIPAYDYPQSNQSLNNDGTNESINGDNNSKTDQPLEVDTNSSLINDQQQQQHQIQQQRPPSTTNMSMFQPPFPFNQMRPAYRYPFVPPNPAMLPYMQQQQQQQQLDQRNTSPSPSFSAFQSPHHQMMFRMQLQQQQYIQQQQQLQQSKSGASSQQPSPGGASLNHSQLQNSLPYSTSFVLNNSSLSNLNDSSSNLNSPRDQNISAPGAASIQNNIKSNFIGKQAIYENDSVLSIAPQMNDENSNDSSNYHNENGNFGV